MITMGAQQALYLHGRASWCGPGIAVGVEEPGYPDARNIFRAQIGERSDRFR